MKKLIVFASLLFLGLLGSSAQIVKFGIKAGANFSDLDGAINTKTKTSYHFGAVVEIKAFPNLSIQPEFLYSTQGAKSDIAAVGNIDFNYVTVPVLAKFYVITNVLCLEVGPQFAFLVNDNVSSNDPSSFDFGAVGGLGVHLSKHVFIQGRYVVGLSDTSKDSEITNRVIQLSLGYTF